MLEVPAGVWGVGNGGLVAAGRTQMASRAEKWRLMAPGRAQMVLRAKKWHLKAPRWHLEASSWH